jgi:hypothetical protein
MYVYRISLNGLEALEAQLGSWIILDTRSLTMNEDLTLHTWIHRANAREGSRRPRRVITSAYP